jgi:hypothetical protein
MKLPKRWKLWLTGAAMLVIAAVVGHWRYERGLVSFLFDIKSVPRSVSSVDCISYGLTDTLVTCAFTIDPSDFDQLLQGETFASQIPPYFKRAHDLETYGPDFEVSYHYQAKPKDSPYGGSLDILADANRQKILAHLYIE